jgi:methyltransferase (TIGR00027 family)
MTTQACTLVLIAMLAAAPAALAVNPGEVSGTAEATCAFRAIGALHPDRKLRNADDVAGKLCRGNLQLPRNDYAAARRYIDAGGDTWAAYFYVNARTRFIDEALKKAAAAGVTQVVVLGAGFDTRAYRFDKTHPQLRFFEVDLPATIEAKQKRVAEAFGAPPKNVRYAPIDFNTQKLEDVLPPLGFDAKQKSFFLLEGVVMYVQMPGNDATFAFMKRNAAPGSVVVYDYVLKDIIDGKLGPYYGSRLVIGVASRGEPYVSGWTPAGAAAYAKKHGFRVVEDLDDKALTKRYLTGTDGKPEGRMIDWHRMMMVRVPEPSRK